jgi:F-type H+-transporting ATPase subunit b
LKRRVAVVLLLLIVPVVAFAQEHHETVKWLGLPAWIWKAVNLIAFGWLLWKFLAGPIKKAFVDRHDKVRSEAEEARARRAKADQLAADIEARLTQIEDDVRSIRQRALADGEKQKREMIAAAEAEAQKILQAARHEVDNRIKRARKELTEYAGQLASDRAEQILRETITDEDRRKLFADSLREVGQA